MLGPLLKHVASTLHLQNGTVFTHSAARWARRVDRGRCKVPVDKGCDGAQGDPRTRAASRARSTWQTRARARREVCGATPSTQSTSSWNRASRGHTCRPRTRGHARRPVRRAPGTIRKICIGTQLPSQAQSVCPLPVRSPAVPAGRGVHTQTPGEGGGEKSKTRGTPLRPAEKRSAVGGPGYAAAGYPAEYSMAGGAGNVASSQPQSSCRADITPVLTRCADTHPRRHFSIIAR